MQDLNNNTHEEEEYSQFLKHIQDEKEETSRFAKTLLAVVSVICLTMIILLCIVENQQFVVNTFGTDSHITKILLDLSTARRNQKRTEFDTFFMPKKQTILVLGIDANEKGTDPWKGTRSDTIILLNIDSRHKSINLISIPRDSKVYLAGNHGVQKINSAHALGGVKLTKRTIEDTLGIKIDKYIIVRDEAVEKIVDAVGGVPIYVEKDMNYHDFAGNLHVDLKQGNTLLDGKQAVGYLRYRKDGLGDIGRTHRQQWFLRGFTERIQTPQIIAKMPEIIATVARYVRTDLSLYEISQLAAFSRGINVNNVEVAVLPGAPNQTGYISYWILDPEKTQEVVNRMIYRKNNMYTESNMSAGIIYSAKRENDAQILKEKLTEQGINVNCFFNAHYPHSQFVAQNDAVDKDYFIRLRRKVPFIKNIPFIFDPAKNYCPNSEFSIILSDE